MSAFRYLYDKFPQGSFSRNVITLITGTTMAQIIPLALSPLLTRLFTPQEFGVFALYSSIVAVLAIIATGRYELAILLPDKEEKALNIFFVAVFICFIVSVISFAVLCCIIFIFLYLFPSEYSLKWLLFIPLSTLFIGVYQTCYYWLNRKKHYRDMSLSKIVQTTSSNIASVGLGWSRSFPLNGLIIGTVFGQGIASWFIGMKFWRESKLLMHTVNRAEMRKAAKTYINFPKVLVVAHAMNTFIVQVPIYIFTILFTSLTVGLFALTQRVLRAPLAVVSSAIGDVFRQRAAEDYRNHGECRQIYMSTLKKVSAIAFIPFLILVITAPALFQIVFGEEWRQAGEFARIMSFMLLVQFISSPLSNMYIIAEKQKEDLIFQIVFIVSNVLVLIAGYVIYRSIIPIIVLYTINNSVIYLINIFITYRFACNERNKKVKVS